MIPADFLGTADIDLHTKVSKCLRLVDRMGLHPEDPVSLYWMSNVQQKHYLNVVYAY
jgi:hypothetical protein